jgi:hypothetical protein
MTTTVILATIGGIAVILTAAARIPAALTEFLRACIPLAAAARELRATVSGPTAHDEPASAHDHASPPDGHAMSVEHEVPDPDVRRP